VRRHPQEHVETLEVEVAHDAANIAVWEKCYKTIVLKEWSSGIVSAREYEKKLAFLTKNTAILCKKSFITLVEKNLENVKTGQNRKKSKK
jgi:hypothetical protein